MNQSQQQYTWNYPLQELVNSLVVRNEKNTRTKLTKHYVSGAGQATFLRKQIKVKTYSTGPDRHYGLHVPVAAVLDYYNNDNANKGENQQ
jgi:hypothetical protein